MINKRYIIVICALAFAGAYFLGGRVATQKCQRAVAERTTATQTAIIKQRSQINESVLHTGTADIRRILHAEYTIAD